MTDIVLFEQYIVGSKNEEENFYVRVTTDRENQNFISNLKILSVSVREQTGVGTPVCAFTVMDLNGDLINHKIVEGDFVFRLIMERDDKQSNIFTLKPTKISATTTQTSRPDQILYTMHLVSHNWERMMSKKRNRSWKDALYSEVVEDIAKDVGFKHVFVTPTKKRVPNIIQPYWTNFEMLRWIKQRVESANPADSGAFDFAATVNDGFYFASMGSLIRQGLSGVQGPRPTNRTRTLVMRDLRTEDYEKGYRKIEGFDITQDFFGSSFAGATGIKPAHYDYMNKKYVINDTVYFSDTDEPQLSDWALVSESQQDDTKILFTHRDTDSEIIAKNKVSDAVNYIQKVAVKVSGICDVNIGDIIEIQIPLSLENSRSIINEHFSGSYLVTMKQSFIDINTPKANTMYKLTRQGVNGVDVKALTKSSRGKSVE